MGDGLSVFLHIKFVVITIKNSFPGIFQLGEQRMFYFAQYIKSLASQNIAYEGMMYLFRFREIFE